MPFDGFPRNVRATPVPDPIFNSLLEEIEDLAELKVTLRLLWLLGQKKGQLKFVEENELLHDTALLRGLRSLGEDPREVMLIALQKAVTRGTMLCYSPNSGSDKTLYLLNSEKGKQDLRRLKQGNDSSSLNWDPDQDIGDAHADTPRVPPLNIFSLYEDNIGTYGQIMADELRDAEQRYPWSWIVESFNLAVQDNRRSWSYISAILRRWASEGKSGGRDIPRTNPRGNEGRAHGKSGRHTSSNYRSRYPQGYGRR